ncbi:MAG: SUF system NifU family Fe-S cluster assembly protein [Ectothiorhodospiraceae bacterium]|nr:SUF system NifU family Fe-S cluster assembly protein [Chromatiales bacterium]MCP5156849.1 SUF system NifU family Fe-S cluster assembly protein [Ectothiorhodospiraceae bacterium]
MDLRDLYEEIILDHNRNPRNYPRHPDGTNRRAEGHNPLCGDQVTVNLVVDGDRIVDVGFEGNGCAISTASASLMTEAVKGMSVADAEALFERLHALLTDEHPVDPETIGKLSVLGGVKDYPMRVKCATLAWHTLHAALANAGDPVTTE